MKGAGWRAEVGTPFSLFRAACPGALPPALVWLFWLGLASCLGGFAPGFSLGSLAAAPQYMDFGVEVGTDLVQPLV